MRSRVNGVRGLLVYVSGDGGLAQDCLPAALIPALSRVGLELRLFELPRGSLGRLDDEELRRSVRTFCAGNPPALPLILCGYSRGARLCVELSHDLQALGVIAFGYPFHGAKQAFDSERVQGLANSKVPVLITQGTRDPHGNRDQVQGYDLPPHVRVQWIQGARHAMTERLLDSQDFAESLLEVASFAAQLLAGSQAL